MPWQTGGKAARSLSSKPHVVETVLGGSALTPLASAVRSVFRWSPASHIPLDAPSAAQRCRLPPQLDSEVSEALSAIRTEETGASKSWHSDGEESRGFSTRATAQRLLPLEGGQRGRRTEGLEKGAGLRLPVGPLSGVLEPSPSLELSGVSPGLSLSPRASLAPTFPLTFPPAPTARPGATD